MHAPVWKLNVTAVELGQPAAAQQRAAAFSAYSISDTCSITGFGFFQPPGKHLIHSYWWPYSMQINK